MASIETELPGPGAPAVAALPDAPVALLRLGADGHLVAANRAACELLGLDAGRLPSAREGLWGLDPAVLGEEGVWTPPDGDAARRVRYRRDGEGWVLSLPHAETAALLDELERLVTGSDPAGVSHPLLAHLARRLEEAAAAQRLLTLAHDGLAGCDLALELPPADAGTPAGRRLAAGFGNFAEAIRQAVALSEQIAQAVPQVVSENDELARQSQAQARALDSVREASRRLLEDLQQVRGELDGVRAVAASADADARRGGEVARTLAGAMQEIERRIARAGEVIEMIDSVAFKTNILSINAGIEAAHAGAAGRGFAVVAAEIRRLAEHTAAAARDVRTIVDDAMKALGQGVTSAEQTREVLAGVSGTLQRAGAAMEQVAGRVAAQGAEVAAIDRAVEDVVALSHSNLEHAARVAERSEALGQGVATLHDCVGLFRLPPDPMREPRHARVRALATDAAARIGQALADAVRRGETTGEALFSRECTPIPGIDPPKYRTAFDALCDRLLPPLQEPVVEAHPWIVFAICANPDGYVPTHNRRYCQPLTGDRARDLVGNRTKRIFSDRVGRSVGAHTDPYRLQVYRRDTGQIMFDLSVPIFVAGRHWGGFRIGYSLE